MSTRRRDPKGDVRSNGNSPVSDSNVTDNNQDDVTKGGRVKYQASDKLGEVLIMLADNDGGYLKVRRSALSPDLHLTWTWTIGKWSGHYVYVRVPFWQLAYGLALLAEKTVDVESGLRKPTPDKRNPDHGSS
jgi:hypothetical protein